MKKYIIDTNALISFVTDRNPDQQQKIAPLFESAARLKALILCHQYVLTEFIHVMDRVYHVPKDKIGRMIADFADMPGVEVIHEIDFKAVLSCSIRYPISAMLSLLRSVKLQEDPQSSHSIKNLSKI